MRNISSINRNKEKGFSLISVLLGGIAVLVSLAGVMTLVDSTTGNAQLAETQTLLISSRNELRKLYGNPADYTDVTNAVVIAAGVVPRSAIVGTGIHNPFGGDVTFAVDAAKKTTFTMTHTDIPKGDCISLAGFSYGEWVSLKINGADISQVAGGVVALANTSCSLALNVMVWQSH
ncbi:MAG: type 4 pilus major pilin [Sedimenticola sp.]